MNVIISNKYQTLLGQLDIEVIKTVNGEFTVEGDQVAIDGENSVTYEPLCPHCYHDKLTEKEKDVGNMPAELCNAIAPLYDEEILVIDSAKVSYVEPISKRSKHADTICSGISNQILRRPYRKSNCEVDFSPTQC